MNDIITGIAWWKTRGFWLGWFPASLTLLEIIFRAIDEGNGTPIAAAISMVTPWSQDEVYGFLVTMSPIYALVVAHQRSGIARPYVNTSTAEKIVRAIKK